MKRAVAAGQGGNSPAVRLLAQEAALGLLARSIAFGHARLAVIRLVMAVHTGAEVPGPHWAYCEQAARCSGERDLLDMLQEAIDRARPRLGQPDVTPAPH